MEIRGHVQADGYRTNPTKPGPVEGLNRLSRRIELFWVAGQRGIPCLNADMASGTEATREVADPWFEVLGTNMTSALSTYNAEGGNKLTTAGASADQAILAPHLDTRQSAWSQYTWGTDKEVIWECDFLTDASIADMILWAGLKLTNTPVIATDDNQVFLRYEAGVASGVFQVASSIGGTDTTTTTTITVAAATRYRLRLAINAARLCTVSLAIGLGEYVTLYTTAALADAIDLIPYFGIQASAGAAKAATVYGEAISRKAG